jgi:hypothetical protein
VLGLILLWVRLQAGCIKRSYVDKKFMKVYVCVDSPTLSLKTIRSSRATATIARNQNTRACTAFGGGGGVHPAAAS